MEEDTRGSGDLGLCNKAAVTGVHGWHHLTLQAVTVPAELLQLCQQTVPMDTHVLQCGCHLVCTLGRVKERSTCSPGDQSLEVVHQKREHCVELSVH